jgi:flagellar hook-length control protein FliK
MENGDPSRMRLDGNAASQPRPEAITGREVEIRTPVGHEAWEKSMARQVLESVREGSQQVKLRLHPDTLGSIEVRVSHDDGGARIQFTTHHAVVKEAMEAAMPRLREMFHGGGMNLLEASVARHGGQQPGQGGAFGQGNGDGHAGQAPASPMPAGRGNDEGFAGERSPATAPFGAIDYYI